LPETWIDNPDVSDVVAAAVPRMLTVAVAGLPRAIPPLAADSLTAKVLVPTKFEAFTGTEKVFAPASPAAQLSVPPVAV
jgi:hypothetical protein